MKLQTMIRIVACNSHNESYQSANKQASTETSLVSVPDDILRCVDEKKAVLLVLLHLSAAFDTVYQDVFLDRMFKQIRILDNSLSWFRSYLSDRSQVVQIDGCVQDYVVSLGCPTGIV